MKKPIYKNIILACLLVSSYCGTASATTATEELWKQYESEGAKNFDTKRGEENWKKQVKNEEGKDFGCESCHSKDLKNKGQHVKTNKVIEPMAPSINPERLTDVKKIEKWFKRNCNDAWGRACTAQEKGDILKYLIKQ